MCLFTFSNLFFVVLKSVDMLTSSGCNSSKIILGLPVYGRNKKNPSSVKTYSEMIDDVLLSTNEVDLDHDRLPGLCNGSFGFDCQDLIFDKSPLHATLAWEIILIPHLSAALYP